MLAMPVRSSVVMSPERRALRLLPTAEVTVTIRGLTLASDLRDLSPFGFAIVASRRFWQGMTHEFTFLAASGLEVTLVAKAVHCQSRIVDGEQQFVTGWEFMRGSADRTRLAIARLLSVSVS